MRHHGVHQTPETYWVWPSATGKPAAGLAMCAGGCVSAPAGGSLGSRSKVAGGYRRPRAERDRAYGWCVVVTRSANAWVTGDSGRSAGTMNATVKVAVGRNGTP